MPARPAPITITTDFGQSDHYVGQMKGAILRVVPDAAIVDITHAIAPQNVRAASFLVEDLAQAFPAGTVHLVVVDPGVGSARRVIALEAGGQFYVAPDNGVLTLILDKLPAVRIVEIAPDPNPSGAISATFHGRDIMAPAAARLARDQRIEDLGGSLAGEAATLAGLRPRRIAGDRLRIEGMVAWVDHFGNMITNIPADMLAGAEHESWEVRCGSQSVRGLRRYYSEVAEGEMLLLTGSSGRLEIAVNGGSAAKRWRAKAGDEIVVVDNCD